MLVQIHWLKAEEVCGQLLTALRNDEFPYQETWALPQTFIPNAIRNDPLLHARFLFYCCHYMRGTIKSEWAIKMLIVLYRTHPELFDPFQAALPESVPVLEQKLGSLIGYKTIEISRFWQENSRRLVEHWNGDPRAIFREVTDAETMYRYVTNKKGKHVDPLDLRTQGFLAFQKKMASMLAYFFMDAGLLEGLTASPPVDFHLLRVMLATGILTFTKERDEERLRYEHLTPSGIAVMKRYVQEHNVSLVELGNALWMLSVVLCSKAPGNVSSGRQKGVHGKLIRPTRVMADWDNPSHRMAYSNSCALCPVDMLCTRNIPSGPYYQSGELEVGDRVRPEQQDLHPLLKGYALPIMRAPARPMVQTPPIAPHRVHTGTLFEELPVQKKPKEAGR